MDYKKSNYKDLTRFIYQDLSWGPLYRQRDGEVIPNADNNAAKYILESLDIMKIPVSDLKNKRVFNIGTGRESRYFANQGAEVFHVDIAKDSSDALNKWAKENNKKVTSVFGNILDVDIGENKFDIIFLNGIYQHIEKPALALVKFINSLKKNGLMYMGFYRSGEWRWFLADSIRYLIDSSMLKEIRDINSILFTFNTLNHYNSTRVMDDFFVPRKHNFHPMDIIHDLELIGGEVFSFDNDLRDYAHEIEETPKKTLHQDKGYFSIGGDRIYITKKNDTITDVKSVEKQLKTLEGRNQLFGVSYKEDIIKENIELIKKIKILSDSGFISKTQIACLTIGLHQFTRPFIFEKSFYYQESLRKGRHNTVNEYLKNFISDFSTKL
jgi:SAM-dependent methyltransferase